MKLTGTAVLRADTAVEREVWRQRIADACCLDYCCRRSIDFRWAAVGGVPALNLMERIADACCLPSRVKHQERGAGCAPSLYRLRFLCLEHKASAGHVEAGGCPTWPVIQRASLNASLFGSSGHLGASLQRSLGRTSFVLDVLHAAVFTSWKVAGMYSVSMIQVCSYLPHPRRLPLLMPGDRPPLPTVMRMYAPAPATETFTQRVQSKCEFRRKIKCCGRLYELLPHGSPMTDTQSTEQRARLHSPFRRPTQPRRAPDGARLLQPQCRQDIGKLQSRQPNDPQGLYSLREARVRAIVLNRFAESKRGWGSFEDELHIYSLSEDWMLEILMTATIRKSVASGGGPVTGSLHYGLYGGSLTLRGAGTTRHPLYVYVKQRIRRLSAWWVRMESPPFVCITNISQGYHSRSDECDDNAELDMDRPLLVRLGVSGRCVDRTIGGDSRSSHPPV
ncbi:hypothetical protein EVAR_8603_1 [Eumeta japonica]|uniref:Uncharacterized protein n=1 Tax=Eumeta variegata TaxID=151549 RepID=A0A4C1XIE4_EUMVA|nr:hypothetical protein EVAR_8603_1 [Eumeta japonica]